MLFSFFERLWIILFLGLFGWLYILPMTAKSQPLCFLVTQDNQVINLEAICGKKIPLQKSPPQSVESPSQKEPTNKEYFSFKNLMLFAGSESIYTYGMLEELPNSFNRVVSQETYEDGQKCQLIIQKLDQGILLPPVLCNEF